MARKTKVNYWATKGGYGCYINKKQVLLFKCDVDDMPLGPNYAAAVKKWIELTTLDNAGQQGNRNSIKVICELYACFLEAQKKKKTLKMFKDCMKSALARFGHVIVEDLRPFNVQKWLDEMSEKRPHTVQTHRLVSWGANMKILSLKFLTVALNWSMKQGYITSHCLQKRGVVVVPRDKSRGREAYLEEQEVALLIEKSNKRMRDLLRFLAATGCRPGEAFHVEARHYHKKDRCIVFPHNPPEGDWIHKTAVKTQKDRVIMLLPDMVELIEALIEKRPRGPLFCNRYGNIWTSNNMAMYIRELGKRVGITKPVIAYSFRHTYATEWLLRGGSIKVLAELLGTSIAMLEKHYGHLEVNRDKLRTVMETIWGDGQK